VTAEAVERLLAAGIRPIRGLFFAAGHFRNGILLAPITARLVVDAITASPARGLSAFALNRFYAELRVV